MSSPCIRAPSACACGGLAPAASPGSTSRISTSFPARPPSPVFRRNRPRALGAGGFRRIPLCRSLRSSSTAPRLRHHPGDKDAAELRLRVTSSAPPRPGARSRVAAPRSRLISVRTPPRLVRRAWVHDASAILHKRSTRHRPLEERARRTLRQPRDRGGQRPALSAALAAVTTTPAKIFGLVVRGTIPSGQPAISLLVGDPFELSTRPSRLIAGSAEARESPSPCCSATEKSLAERLRTSLQGPRRPSSEPPLLRHLGRCASHRRAALASSRRRAVAQLRVSARRQGRYEKTAPPARIGARRQRFP